MANAITGGDDFLQPYLEEAIQRADRIRLIIAFVMESGAKILAPYLQQAVQRGVPIQLLTGRYMGVTEPAAIYHLLDRLGDNIDIRFFSEGVRSFHPKAFIFETGEAGEIFVGSSNLSRSALAGGVEWNYRFYKAEHPEDFQDFSDTFDELFYNNSVRATPEVLKAYAMTWKKSAFVRAEELAAPEEIAQATPIAEPRGAQIEALYYLKQAHLEKLDKGMVVAATGIGKTHLAAFDSTGYHRVLFLAHREEIVSQAYRIFQELRPLSRLGYFTGAEKNNEAEICFSTVQTISRLKNLLRFEKDYFDYIVVDEFHHAAADSYRKVIDYFKPEFLLGLTATPYRMDNQDIFSLFDDNIIYEISLKQAIERDHLVPFHYGAVYDPTDYNQIAMVNGRYAVDELEKQLSRRERADLILHHYQAQAGQRTIGFCVSISHAEYMADYFKKHGIPAAAVHSGISTEDTMDRQEAILALTGGKIKVIFAVDIFNEGVDIPAIDTVMFLRPTESYVIFLQQLGRGLRKHPGKEYLTVIDFIGNYKRAHYLPLLLAGENPMLSLDAAPRRIPEYEFPEGCLVNFDFRIIDLFKELADSDPLPMRMRDTYQRIKQSLGRRPDRLDIYEGSDIPIREFLKHGWLRFLQTMDDLQPEEASWLETPAEDFLKDIERTAFSKAYKLPTIGSFLLDDTMTAQVDMQSVGENMMTFYRDHPVHQKDLRDKSHKNWRRWGVTEFTKLARNNPVHFLSNGEKKFFRYDEVNRIFSLRPSLAPFISPGLAGHLKDILEYREIDYFRRRFKD